MQNRYVGDIGDYVKLAILRSLSPGFQIGVAWWLYPDESHNSDGAHVDYLRYPDRWRNLDPELFDGLKGIVTSKRRHVSALEMLLPGAAFATDIFPQENTPNRRIAARDAWLSSVKDKLRSTNLVFIDPDNGIQTLRFSAGQKRAGKSVSFRELLELGAHGRPLLVYHHQTRRKGGHLAEIEYLSDVLRDNGFHSVDALRAPRYSPRAFFLLNAPSVMRERAKAFSEKWAEAVTWHPGKPK